MVGAVVVKGGEVIGRGYHRRAGAEHAEVIAIRAAGKRVRGARLYVNLEPCNHEGRTGPCARAVIEAGISHVVIGMKDPNPLVNGKGISALRRAGLSVSSGVLERECQQLNEAFCCYIQRRRPFVTFKAAITLDGRVAAPTGDSRWVTDEPARREGHKLRDSHDVIAVGVGTVLKDDPELTCRGIRGGRDPVRVIVDSRLRTPPTAKAVRAAARSSAPTWIITTTRAAKKRARELEAAGAVVVRIPAPVKVKDADRRVDIGAMLTLLAEREILGVLLEGGPTLAGAFWREGLVDRVVAFLAPKILADPTALPMLAGRQVRTMSEATQLRDVTTRRVGGDLMLTGTPVHKDLGAASTRARARNTGGRCSRG
jgi:diaminohydroxyphosphoribosylaminopyrimidine deaminase/5-amino-6-(5-phosphoribosylamino)uracil reductase